MYLYFTGIYYINDRGNKVKKIKLRQIQYHVAYRKRGEKTFHVIKNNLNSWVADPFFFEYENDIYIFGEMWLNQKGKGVIAFSKWNGKGFSRWNPVIEENYHLSYPNIFMNNGNIYICPESNESNEIYLYKAIEFPYKWKKVHIMLSGDRYVDTTFFKYNNEVYGLTYRLEEKRNDINGQLYVFKIENQKVVFLDNNPVSESDRIARPAGKCIERNKKIIRVSQNCENIYGKGLMFSEMNFDGTEYSEHLLCEIYPDDINYDAHYNLIGVHTYNEIDNFQVIDLRSYDFSLILLIFKIVNKIKAIVEKRKF